MEHGNSDNNATNGNEINSKLNGNESKSRKDEKLMRVNRSTLLFNHREKEAIDLYCQKYKINNKSKFMREAIMTEILKKFDEDYPTLFEFEKPNLFYQR